MSSGSKPTCGGAVKCPYFHPVEGAESSSAILSGNGRRNEPGFGQCHLNPPQMVMAAQQNALGQMQQGMIPLYPLKHLDGFCSHHPAIVLSRTMFLEKAKIRAQKDALEFDPSKYGDNAGYSRAPTLAEAKTIGAGPHKDSKDGAAS